MPTVFRSESSSGQNELLPGKATTTCAAGTATSSSDFTDLNYVLRKNNNYVVGQRLAVTASAEAENEGGEKTSKEQDLLLTSPTMPVKEQLQQPPNSLDVVMSSTKGPIVGVSPLDQPLVNFGISLKDTDQESDDPHQQLQTQQPSLLAASNNKINGNIQSDLNYLELCTDFF